MRLVAIVGTKKSGKTTVVERMLPALKARGLTVGTLKLIHHEAFTIHPEGRDTARHWQAGAAFTMALAPGETTLVRRTGGRHETLSEAQDLIPAWADVLLCEGLVAGGDDVRTVVCLVEASEARAVLNGLPYDAHPVAVSGRVTAEEEEVEGLPALDANYEDEVGRLIDLVMG